MLRSSMSGLLTMPLNMGRILGEGQMISSYRTVGVRSANAKKRTLSKAHCEVSHKVNYLFEFFKR